MAIMNTNYFVCTLGEATQPGFDRPFRHINHLIETQAQQNPNLLAVGFYDSTQNGSELGFTGSTLTFQDLQKRVLAAACILSKAVSVETGQTVALLADSSPEFFFTWLGCIRLGYPVLLIAPQCSASAIAGLCSSCNVRIIFTDQKHQSLVHTACEDKVGISNLKCVLLPFSYGNDLSCLSTRSFDSKVDLIHVDNVAYLHHSSGTSTGILKPIPQTHHGAVGVLPALNGRKEATFTTTPLYHGGPADVFRAWTSSALIWLFPSHQVPITPKNILQCLVASEGISDMGRAPPVKYFTSVPYVLQMMANDEQGLKWLQKMDIVGVGGAALPSEVGDQLVEQKVRLASRFGSAECGFLLSSHRDYDADEGWQYLRHNPEVQQSTFEPNEGGLYELVVGSDWPHLAKRNRPDGSYSTSDLFARHSTVPNAWKHHSRADSQLTLLTGKKFDPASLEDSINAASVNLSDVLIFGNGRPYPGVLLFRSKCGAGRSDAELKDEVGPVIETLGSEIEKHAKIPPRMLIFMPFDEAPLEKSSKGTILRKLAEQKFATQIDKAYDSTDGTERNIDDAQLPSIISDLVASVLKIGKGAQFDVQEDLFALGADSVACVQIRQGLLRLRPKDVPLPLTVVEDSRTISGLVEFMKKLRHGDKIVTNEDNQSQILKLLETYSNLEYSQPSKDTQNGNPRTHNATVVAPSHINILLTGATGSLGSHVLHQLLQKPEISHIYLLIRGATQRAAKERVLKALSSRKFVVPDDFDQRVTILQCKLSEATLGIKTADHKILQKEIDVVFHLAWSVNFLLSLQSFKPQFEGLQNLLQLCLSSKKSVPPRMVFCSSVASVSNFPVLKDSREKVPEDIISDFYASGSTGYAQSKLTAELILARAATVTPSLRNRITIIRVGQLSADTQCGIWNKSEAYPQILATAKITDGDLPDLEQREKLTWLPVDVAAEAFIEASLLNPEVIGKVPTEHVKHETGQQQKAMDALEEPSLNGNSMCEIRSTNVKVLHLFNPNTELTFTDFAERLQRLLQENGDKTTNIRVVPKQQWLDKLAEIDRSRDCLSSEVHQLLRLLPFWQSAYGDRANHPDENISPQHVTQAESADTEMGSEEQPLGFDMHKSLLSMPSLCHWLGLSTFEGQQAQAQAQEYGLDLTQAETEDHKVGEGPTRTDLEHGGELLKREYVLKIWNWVYESVP